MPEEQNFTFSSILATYSHLDLVALTPSTTVPLGNWRRKQLEHTEWKVRVSHSCRGTNPSSKQLALKFLLRREFPSWKTPW